MSIDVNTEQVIDTRITTTLSLKREHIIAFLRREGLEIPDDAEVFMGVPGGGDWSGENLHIDTADESTLYVRCRTNSTERSEFDESTGGTP